jgi:hypothetical protein
MTLSPRMGAKRWAAASVAALAAAWVAAPAAIPLYDGPGFPDEPYRYVSPPAGAKATPAATTAQQTLQVRSGLSTAGFVNSGERGPQISIYIPPTGLQPPTGATTITVTATPLAPAAPLPTDGKIVGNVYKFAATTPQGAVKIVGNTNTSTPVIQMRSPTTTTPLPVFEYLAPSGWKEVSSFKVAGKKVNTLRVGQDIFQTFAPQFGDYALVVLDKQPSSGGGGGVNWALLGPGVGILGAVALIAPIRIARSRRSA